MKKTLGLLLTLAIATAACGGSSSDPASAGSCEELADVSVEIVQGVLDSVAGMSEEEFFGLDELPAAFLELEQKGEDLERRADEIGCTEAEAQALACERIGNLKADGEAAQGLFDSFIDGC